MHMPPATCEAVNAETPHASLDSIVVRMLCSGGVVEKWNNERWRRDGMMEEEKHQQRDRRK
jgi:hypothetical protein